MTEETIKMRKAAEVQEKVLSWYFAGLAVAQNPDKGRVIIATDSFKKENFVVDHDGELLTILQAKERELGYQMDSSIGSYMYYFEIHNKKYCIDATVESGKLGRLVNHSKQAPTCKVVVVEYFGRPHVLLVACEGIEIGAEITYDYGDRTGASLAEHPWLAF